MLEEDKQAAVAAVARIAAVPTMLRVIAEVTGLRLALVAHVTESSWTCCAVPRFESYVAVPIFLPNGVYFGNVCALDSRPIDLSPSRTLSMFQLFAQLVGMQLAAEAEQAATSAALLDARETAELREQFIAVLGHDLRSPLQAIAMGSHALVGDGMPDRAVSIGHRIGRSAARIGRLIDDVVDFARGRLGGGIALQPSSIADVGALLRPVVEELRSVYPERHVDLTIEGSGRMSGDPVCLAQLLQNLLANALSHSPPGTPVAVSIRALADRLVLSVTNGGPAIPDEIRGRMFEPYRRGTDATPGGLGLGLYIASQIVRSHAGTIEATSVDGETTIVCSIPRRDA